VPAGRGGSTFFGSSRYRVAVAGLLVLSLAVFGGASRADEPAQLAVRLAAILALATTLWPLNFTAVRMHGRILLFAVACAALPLLQLLPLPPAWWAALPGHAPYAEIAEATATSGWRPLSLTPDLTVNALQALLIPAATLVAALYLDARNRTTIAAAFVVVAFGSALLGLAQLAAGENHLRLFEQSSENAPVGLFANRNHQAALLACALPLGAAVLPRIADERAWTVIVATLVAAAGTLCAVVLLTGSRMGVLLLALAVVGAGWVANKRGLLRRPATGTALVAWSASGLAIALVAGALFLESGLLERFRGEGIIADTRGAALPSLMATAGAFLPTGAGFGSFDSVYRQFEPDSLLSTIYLNHAHNEPLQLAIEGGIPALLLLLVFLLWWARSAAAILANGKESPRRGLPTAALVVTFLLMASSLVEYPLRSPLIAALFTFCCAVIAMAAGRDERPRGAE
jgi:O-antigen ligase